MRSLIRKIYAPMLALFLTLMFCGSIYAQTESNWEYRDGNWYYTDANGKQAKNQWLKTGSTLYWMNEDGTMATDTWIERERQWYYLDGSGAAVTGWKEIDGKWYYFEKDTFTMATNTTIGSWYVGADGAWDPSK
ncbi:MAG: hypothetical protein LIO92_11525 [Clostridiales bacterium]|nr:hypothetical protein [Clostridiales bacterium]